MAFHVRGYNTRGYGIEICTQASKWEDIPDWHATALMKAGARDAARVAKKFGVPVAYRTKAQIDSGLPGITGHTDLDPTRRSDPGFTTAQWGEFLGYVNDFLKEEDDTMLPLYIYDGYDIHPNPEKEARPHKKSDVAAVQAMMNRAFGLDLDTDGKYGPATRDAIKDNFLNASGEGNIFYGNLYDDLVAGVARVEALAAIEGIAGLDPSQFAPRVHDHPKLADRTHGHGNQYAEAGHKHKLEGEAV